MTIEAFSTTLMLQQNLQDHKSDELHTQSLTLTQNGSL